MPKRKPNCIKDVASSFACPKGVILNVRKNKSGAPIVPFSAVKTEEEVIVLKGTKYKVLGISKDDYSSTLVELEEV